jgi:hypothetical protein
LAVTRVDFVNKQWLRIFLVDLGSLSDNVLLLFAFPVEKHLRGRVNEVALDARVLLGHLQEEFVVDIILEILLLRCDC